jgi:hypothetical protein
MSKLFNISDEERERIKFLHETKNPHAVIVEQPFGLVPGADALKQKAAKIQKNYNNYSRFGNQPANTKGDYNMVSKGLDSLGVKGLVARDRERLNNIANMKKQAAANKGMVTVGGKPMKWTDYIATYNIQPDEIKAAENINVTSNAASKNQQDRYNNIVNIQNTVDANGIIQNKASSYNGKTWSEYISQYKITPDEIKKANDYVASLGKQVKTPPPAAGNTQVKGGIRQSGGAPIADRFSKSAQSIGVQNGKMDLQTLQTILKTLNGGTEATTTASTGGAPDMTQLTTALNALKQG